MERSVHTVAVVRTRPRLGRVRQDHLHLPSERLPAVHVPGVLLLREEVLLEEDLVSAAPAGAALTGGPGTSVETATEPVLSIVTLVVVGEVECSQTFTHASSLKRHALLHSGKKQFQCEQCGKEFFQKVAYETHCKSHTRERLHCKGCNQPFLTKYLLNFHLKSKTVCREVY